MARSRASWSDEMVATVFPPVTEPMGGRNPRPALVAGEAAALPHAESPPARSGPGVRKSAALFGQHAHTSVPHTAECLNQPRCQDRVSPLSVAYRRSCPLGTASQKEGGDTSGPPFASIGR